MDIKLDNTHILKSDPYCFWVVQVVSPKGRKPYEKRVSGYSPDLQGALTSYIDTHVKSSDAKSLADLSKSVEELKQEVKDFCKALQEAKDDQ